MFHLYVKLCFVNDLFENETKDFATMMSIDIYAFTFISLPTTTSTTTKKTISILSLLYYYKYLSDK